MAVIHNLDSKNIKLRWNLENKQVWVTCHSSRIASAYISKLIHQKRIGTISAVFYREDDETNVVHVFSGERIVRFIQEGFKKEYRTKTKFTDLLKKNP